MLGACEKASFSAGAFLSAHSDGEIEGLAAVAARRGGPHEVTELVVSYGAGLALCCTAHVARACNRSARLVRRSTASSRARHSAAHPSGSLAADAATTGALGGAPPSVRSGFPPLPPPAGPG